ncbi:hypothetical protein [Staphylococcus petrasii]|uniref:hypothetical protein n=1 Tax=Staphylococcus petrasii TaxID=1276936 RepID=UPI001F590E98|nr:hypothetical protein [Staphylococcus petrasii]MCI2774929.1 hypothetical protein [Staphylococcus petrasii]
MELIGKIISFTMETISNWLGSNDLIEDIKMAKVKRNSYKINKRCFSREISLEKRLSIFTKKSV